MASVSVMSKRAKILLIIGLVLTFGSPSVGLIVTVLGMTASFHQLGRQGIASPDQLASSIGEVLMGTYLGLIGASVGVCVLIAAVAVIVVERRKSRGL
jgi:biopolymer transport protein ExbB/TolQ